MPTMLHQDIVKFLFMLLESFVKAQCLGRVYFAPLPVKLSSVNYREPDIAFLESHRIKETEITEGADLAMEVVSPDAKSRNRDLETKRQEYARAKIPNTGSSIPKRRSSPS